MLLDINPTQIIMVAYHRPNDFKQCVESIIHNTDCPYHLSIIDNSKGKIDQILKQYSKHPTITIYKNNVNIGKGAAVNKWYHVIMHENKLAHFVSIDSDIIVYPGWLVELQRSFYHAKRMTKVGLIAPAICNNQSETWQHQLKNRLIMHDSSKLVQAFDIYPGMYYNRYTAGPLLIIDVKFFESVGLFYDKQLYGADDGQLCAAANINNAFIGINSKVLVEHVNNDSDTEYIQWKARNITMDVDRHGRWDQ
jgi:glycosyltransferase involved in cell wall biosynthesis